MTQSTLRQLFTLFPDADSAPRTGLQRLLVLRVLAAVTGVSGAVLFNLFSPLTLPLLPVTLVLAGVIISALAGYWRVRNASVISLGELATLLSEPDALDEQQLRDTNIKPDVHLSREQVLRCKHSLDQLTRVYHQSDQQQQGRMRISAFHEAVRDYVVNIHPTANMEFVIEDNCKDQKVLMENDGNISETARQLKMHRRTLQRKLQKKLVAG